MEISLRKRNPWWWLGIPLFFWFLILVFHPHLQLVNQPDLALALSVDLLLTIPLIYFLVIRKTSISKLSVLPLVIVGLLIGFYVIPESEQGLLRIFKNWLLPILELFIFSAIILKFRKVYRRYQQAGALNRDFFSKLKESCASVLPSFLVVPFAMEISVFYFGFLHWKKRNLNKNEFSYHIKSGTAVLLMALVVVIAAETVGIHFMLVKRSVSLAWTLTGLSIYTGIQFVGFARSISKRPIFIGVDTLYLNYGIMTEMEIPLGKIKEIRRSTKDLEPQKGVRRLSPLGELEATNIIISLHESTSISGMYGIRKSAHTIAFFVDEPAHFIERLQFKKDELLG
jgi:hypothetical protein